MPKVLVLTLTLLSTSLWTPVLGAAELAGVEMPDSVTVDDQQLVLNGLGLRKKSIVKVYVGGLYLPAKASDASKILAADTPRRLTMQFLYKVSASRLTDAWDEGLENNTPRATEEVGKGFEQLGGWMADMVKGERMEFTYSPGTGTEVTVKGQRKGVIVGKPFADALFACWIGREPPSSAFKAGLLGE
ncbi:MAG: chalcone isomerase family protein [Acidobacteriota bacterium]